jgi:hypothetical protein
MKNALFTVLIVAAMTFVMGCGDSPENGTGQKITGWPLKIGGAYKGKVFAGAKINYPATTTFKTADGALSGAYELDDNGEKVTGTLSDFKPGAKNTLTCTWTDKNGSGGFTLTFSEDLSSFTGKWTNEEGKGGGAWNGKK